MPTYQYSCTDCGHFFEAVQSFADDSLTVCPVCDGRLRKVFNAVGVVFKGSGFYRNDSRAAAGAGSSGEGTGGSKDGGSKDGGSKDAGSSTPTKDSGSGGGSKDGGGSSTPSKDSGSGGSSGSASQTKSA